MSKPLKTVDEHNAERQAALARQWEPIGTGVACQRCGRELTRQTRQRNALRFMVRGQFMQFVAHCKPCNLSVTLWS